MAGHSHTVEIVCAQCGTSATKIKSGGKPAMFCSNACKVSAYKARDPQRLAARREADRAKARAAYVPKVREPREPKSSPPKLCRSCSTIVAKGKQRCDECRDAQHAAVRRAAKGSESYQRCKRANKARRRAVERGARAERFDPFEIFNRDGWRCHMCGCSTPKRLRGSYDDRAPEIDHLIPLAAGGEHTRRNVACSCRKCNIMKSDKPLGQLRLVA